MSEEQTTAATAAPETSEAADVTAATDTTTTADTETLIDATADQETSATSETQTEEQVSSPEQTTDETSAETVVDRMVPDIGDYVLPEGVPIEMAQFAKDADYTQAQLDRTIEKFGQVLNANEQGKQEALRQTGETHVQSWGQQKDYNLNLVQRALKQNDPEGTMSALLDESGYGNHPAVLDFFLNIGNSMREGGFLNGSVNTPKGTGGATAASSMFGGNHPTKS